MTVLDSRRLNRVQRAVDEWVKQLIDVSGNNRLLYYGLTGSAAVH